VLADDPAFLAGDGGGHQAHAVELRLDAVDHFHKR
jgi:hypothetical protein